MSTRWGPRWPEMARPQCETRLAAFALAALACLASAATASLAQDELRTIKHADWVGGVAFAQRANELLTACADGRVRQWNLRAEEPTWVSEKQADVFSSIAILEEAPGQVVAANYDGTVRRLAKESEVLARHRGPALSLARNREGLIASGGMDGTIRLFEIGSSGRERKLALHKSWVNSLDFDTGGGMLISGSSDGTVRLWNVQTAELSASFEITKAEVRAVAFAPHDGAFVAGLRYGEVQLWNISQNKRLHSFHAHDGDCWAVRFSPDGKTLITGGGDWGKPGEVKLWNAKTGELRRTLKHSGEVLSVAVSRDGGKLAAGGGDGNVKVWSTAGLIGISP